MNWKNKFSDPEVGDLIGYREYSGKMSYCILTKIGDEDSESEIYSDRSKKYWGKWENSIELAKHSGQLLLWFGKDEFDEIGGKIIIKGYRK